MTAGTITCSGGGTPYGARAARMQSSVCIHAYSSSSAGQPSPNGDSERLGVCREGHGHLERVLDIGGLKPDRNASGDSTSSVTGLRVAQIESVQDT